jgi:hypothetical protein
VVFAGDRGMGCFSSKTFFRPRRPRFEH